MQRHIPAITKWKQAWDNYSRQHGGTGVTALWNLGETATHPSQTILNSPPHCTKTATGLLQGLRCHTDVIVPPQNCSIRQDKAKKII